MTGRAGIILQARLASARLPFKAVAPLAGQPLLVHCLERLQASAMDVILATTTRPEDDALADMARSHGAQVYRGDAVDVLGRYLGAARVFELDHIIRATGDNPAVETGGPDRVLAALVSAGADLAVENDLPYGTCVEAMTRSALERAARECLRPQDREHVTLGPKEAPDAYSTVAIQAPAALRRPDLRFTVDTRADLLYMRDVFRAAGVHMPTLGALIGAADRFQRSEVA